MDEEHNQEEGFSRSRRDFAKKALAFGLGVYAVGPAAFAQESSDEMQDKTPITRLSGHYAFVHGEDQPIHPDLSENADKVFYTASLIKLVTLAAIFEDVRSGKMDWNDKIKVSNRAMNMSEHTSWYQELSVRDACEMAGSISLNDAAMALAERLGAGAPTTGYVTDKMSRELEQKCVTERMMPLVKDLGMHDTLCANATGFPIYSKAEARNHFRSMGDLPNSHSTMKDMAILASHILSEYPDYVDVFSVPYVDMYAQKPTKIYSSNLLLPGNNRNSAEPYDGVFGMKTGFINASNHNLICLKEVDDKTIVSITIGSKQREQVKDQTAAMDNAVEAFQSRQLAKLDLGPEHP